MKTIYIILSSIGLAFLINACGGGGSGDTYVGGGENQISITDCNATVALLDGDTVVKETDNTSVKIIDTSGNKTICVLTGLAHIVRQ